MARQVVVSYPGGAPSLANVTDVATGETLQGVHAVELYMNAHRITAVLVRHRDRVEAREPVEVAALTIQGALEEATCPTAS